MMSVVIVFRKSLHAWQASVRLPTRKTACWAWQVELPGMPHLSWLTTTRVFFHRCKYSSSHSTARRSRWFVGCADEDSEAGD